MFCRQCGSQVGGEDTFCGSCGAPVAQAPVAGQAPATQQTPPVPPPAHYVAPPAQPRSKTPLVIALVVVGVLVLACAGAGIGGYFWFASASRKAAEPAIKGDASAETAESGVASASSGVATSSTGWDELSQPRTTAKPVPKPPPVTLTEAAAVDLVGNYLDDAKSGRSSQAKAVVTAKYRSRITGDYYSLVARELRSFEVQDTQRDGASYLVFVKETWDTGVWTNWYRVLVKSGKLVIDDTGTE